MRLSLSIEDTNRLRAKVGLRLIRDGPETLVDDGAPSQRVQQLQARILAAEERAEERAQHAAATEGPALASSDAEPTLSWLDRMRQQRSAAPAEPSQQDSLRTSEANPKPLQVVETPTYEQPAGEPSTDKQSAKRASETSTSATAAAGRATRSGPGAQKEPIQDITKLDPLEAPAEPRRELKRQAQLDYETKTAVFKPKKVKTSSKTRTRSSEPALVVPETRDAEPARARAPSKSPMPSPQHFAHAAEAAPDTAVHSLLEPTQGAEETTGLILGPTQTFLRELRQGRTAPSEAQEAPQQQEVAAKATVLEEADDDETRDAESLPSEEMGLGSTASVAETLKMLQSERKIAPSSKQTARSRREWSQRLAATRLAKQAQLESDLQAFKHLPPHERQKAYELHKKELAAQDAQAAKELFEDYSPDVDFERRDEQGNVIDGRQAFKLLSSAFHGAKGHASSRPKPVQPQPGRGR